MFLQIVHKVKARTAFNPYWKSLYVYIAREGFNENPCVVKFSMVEAHRFKCFLDHVLRQISRVESRFQLIEFFKDNEKRAYETVNPNDRPAFWNYCDLNMFHLSVRLTFNTYYCDYVVHMINRVSQKVQRNYDNWPGSYVNVYGTDGITKLRDFLASAISKEEQNPTSAPPVRPE